MEDLSLFSKEDISLPFPPPHILEIHIKQLQVNTCERMGESKQDHCEVWIPQLHSLHSAF